MRMSRWGAVFAATCAFWVTPSARAVDNDNDGCIDGTGLCCTENASPVEGSGPGFEDGWACMCDEGYQVEEQGETTVCGIAPGGGPGPGGEGDPGGGAGGGGDSDEPEPDCVESEPVPPAGRMTRGAFAPATAAETRAWKDDYAAKKGPPRPKPDKECKDKKKQACQSCKNDRNADTQEVQKRFNECVKELNRTASDMCHLGNMADGRKVGNLQVAQDCLATHGGWHPSCQSAIPMMESECHVEWVPPFGMDSVCEQTDDKWRSCIESWTRGNGATVTSYGASGGASWNTPVGIEVKLGADYKETISWKPSEGGQERCNREKRAREKLRDKHTESCQKQVNGKYQGGERCLAF